MAAPYKLSAQLLGHDQDARAVAVDWEGDFVVSASRDRSVRVWKPTHPGYVQKKAFIGHEHFVGSVLYIPTISPQYPGGALASGGHDKVIHIWPRDRYAEDEDISLEPDAAAHATLEGHTGPISCLGLTAGGEVISGSWDKSARIWRSAHVQTLKGHEAAVWGVLGLPNGNVLTASADKTIKCWDGDGNCLHTYTGHEDCVRALIAVDGLGFASCSNDGSIRIWSLDGDVLQVLTGHESFVYNLAFNQQTGEIVSCGEDGNVKVWKDGQCIDSLHHPCTTWDVACLPNGDIVAACADGVLRVWTRDDGRVADAETTEAFLAALSAAAAEKAAAKEKKLASYPDKEALKTPGRKNGETKVVRNGDKAEAHMWNATLGKWDLVGEVVDDPGDDAGSNLIGGKKLLNGKEYDFVFDVDLGDGGGHRKLGYNRGQNPYMAAQEFIWNEELNQDFLDQIAQFIETNAGGGTYAPTQGMSGDPLTGGSRYVPTAPAGGGVATGGDPFTGGSRYVPGGASAAAPTPAPAAAPVTAPAESFPIRGMSTFEQRKFAPALKKINETRNSAGGLAVADDDVPRLEAMTTLLSETSRYHATKVKEEDVKLMFTLLFNSPREALVPVLDIFRQLVLHPSTSALIIAEPKIIPRLVEVGLSSECPFPNQLLVIRTLSNMFWSAELRDTLLEHSETILDSMADFSAHAKANIRLSVASVLLNYAVLFSDRGLSSDHKLQCLSTLADMLAQEEEGENLTRVVKAIGTLVHKDSVAAQTAKDLGVADTLTGLQTSPRGVSVKGLCAQVQKLL